MKDKKKPEYYVYIENPHKRKIVEYNIFEHPGLVNTIKNAVREAGEDKQEFLKRVTTCLVYHFWAKYEYEITLWDWTPHEDFEYKKIDAYSQIAMNWDAFSEYVWNHRKEF